MQILRKVYEDTAPIYHIKTNLGLLVKVKITDEYNKTEIKKLLTTVAEDMDDKLKNNVE
ncbi:MAG TPA: C1q-binding complement inhibitor VraX [Staphylococcus sp.]|nr:C1q-binding complement inhibitor VraX [Staphylococcus sp.]